MKKVINKAKKRYIAVTGCILFFIFAVIFAVLTAFYRENYDRVIRNTLFDVQRGIFIPDDEPTGENPDFGRETDSRFSVTFTVICQRDSEDFEKKAVTGDVSDRTIKEIVTAAKEKEFPQENGGQFGAIGGYGRFYYLVSPAEDGKIQISAADMSTETERYRVSVRNAFLLILSGFTVLLAVACFSAEKVFDPVRRTLKKQRQFISDAGHELKTPVAIISANADVISAREDDKSVQSIKNQANRLNVLLSDLLTIAKIDEGSYVRTREKFNLSDETVWATLPFETVAFENGKTLITDIDEDIVIDGDKDGFKKIVGILLDNAVRYAADKGNVKVSLKKAGNRPVLTVYNDGSGIPEEDSQKIFERFYRGDDSRSRNTGGNGLGLAIAKNVAVSNKWDLSAESVKGVSMTITLAL